jgi:hypothetical protein
MLTWPMATLTNISLLPCISSQHNMNDVPAEVVAYIATLCEPHAKRMLRLASELCMHGVHGTTERLRIKVGGFSETAVDVGAMHALLSKLPRLTELSMIFRATEPRKFVMALTDFSGLRSLKLRDCIPESLAPLSSLTQLTSLEVYESPEVSPEVYTVNIDAIAELRRLRSLDLAFERVKFTSRTERISELGELVHFSLCLGGRIKGEKLRKLCTLTNLTALTLDCGDLTDEEDLQELSKLTALRNLTLDDCYEFQFPIDVFSVIGTMPRLRVLDCDCPNMWESSARAVRREFPDLALTVRRAKGDDDSEDPGSDFYGE